MIGGELHFFKDGWAYQWVYSYLQMKLNNINITLMSSVCFSTEITGRCLARVIKDPWDHLLLLRIGQHCQQLLTPHLKTFWLGNSTSSQVTNLYRDTVWGTTVCWIHFYNDNILSIGNRFWVYTGQSVLGPRNIEKLGLPNSIQKVEGALQRGKGKVLLFSGEHYWR